MGDTTSGVAKRGNRKLDKMEALLPVLAGEPLIRTTTCLGIPAPRMEFCRVNGELVYLWRAVDQDGETLDVLVQKRCNAKAAKRFFRKLLKGLRYSPRAIVTDKLSSYVTAHAEVMPEVEHRRGAAEQPCRELTSAAPRTTHASVQVRVSPAALSFLTWQSVETFPS